MSAPRESDLDSHKDNKPRFCSQLDAHSLQGERVRRLVPISKRDTFASAIQEKKEHIRPNVTPADRIVMCMRIRVNDAFSRLVHYKSLETVGNA
jgi:hypothetical protein